MQGDPKPTAASGPRPARGGDDARAAAPRRDFIGESLRRAFRNVENEALPDRLAVLLQRIAEAERDR